MLEEIDAKDEERFRTRFNLDRNGSIAIVVTAREGEGVQRTLIHLNNTLDAEVREGGDAQVTMWRIIVSALLQLHTLVDE